MEDETVKAQSSASIPGSGLSKPSELSIAELSALVAERIMGAEEVEMVGGVYRYRNRTLEEMGGRWTSLVPNFANDISAAMQVAERMIDQDWKFTLRGLTQTGEWFAAFSKRFAQGIVTDKSCTRAVCLAALQATATASAPLHDATVARSLQPSPEESSDL